MCVLTRSHEVVNHHRKTCITQQIANDFVDCIKLFSQKLGNRLCRTVFCLCLPKALPQVEIGCGFHTLWDIPVTTKVIYARFKFHSSRICSISFGFHSTLREIVSNFQESGDRSNFFFFCSKRPFWWTVFKNNIQKFQRVFILAKNTKVRNRPKRT